MAAKPDLNMVIAVTMKDAILMRLIEYTPIESANEAVIFAYTKRQFRALESFIKVHDVKFDLETLEMQLNEAELEATQVKSWIIPSI